MGCGYKGGGGQGKCCTAQRLFVYVNIGFAMYAGALLATVARLAWDPSTYTWFRWLCALQYRVTTGYLFGAGLWLIALVYLAATAVHPRAKRNLRIYCCGVVLLCASEAAYGAWLVCSMWEWWRTSPQAQVARKGMDLIHDLKPVLLTLERHQEIARDIYQMIEETEREAPNNIFVVIVFALVAVALQVMALVIVHRLVKGSSSKEIAEVGTASSLEDEVEADERDQDDEEEKDSPSGWRKTTNLRMYTIIDKIF